MASSMPWWMPTMARHIGSTRGITPLFDFGARQNQREGATLIVASWSFTTREAGASWATTMRTPSSGGRVSSRNGDNADHYHRTKSDQGRPYKFVSLTQLFEDFYRRVEKALGELNVPTDITHTTGT